MPLPHPPLNPLLPGVAAPDSPPESVLDWHCYLGHILLDNSGQPAQNLQPARHRHFLGWLNHHTAVFCHVHDQLTEPAENASWVPLRSALSRLPAEWIGLASRAVQIAEWDRSHRFCGACGSTTVPDLSERSRTCPACGQVAYPRISPAMMALVVKGDQLLLARSPHFPPGVYSALAGFVEPGESLEQCVIREIEEEVGIQVQNLRYFGSQSWPFPHSLMLAFVADWAGGAIRPQAGEIEDAQWFAIADLPKLPFHFSIARQLIEAVVNQRRRDNAG